jgi:hypothetical protein
MSPLSAIVQPAVRPSEMLWESLKRLYRGSSTDAAKSERAKATAELFTPIQKSCVRCGAPITLKRFQIFRRFLCDACERNGGRSPRLAGLLPPVIPSPVLKEEGPPLDEWQVVEHPKGRSLVRIVLDEMVFGF